MAFKEISGKQLLPERFIPGLIFATVVASLWLGFNFASGQIGQAVLEVKTVPAITRTLVVGSADEVTGGEVSLWQIF